MARDQASDEGNPCSRSTVDPLDAVTIPAQFSEVVLKIIEGDIVASIMASVF